MPRPTLKLPRPASPETASGQSRLAHRKPIRGGSPTAKHSAPRPPVAPAPVAEEPAARPAKLHPPRGVARSTGARAFPPAAGKPTGERSPDRAAAVNSPARSVEPVAGVRPAACPPEREEKTTETPRGVAKEPPRLAKLVCRLTLCSRREADEWIENGRVSVDGKVVTRLGARANPNARIEIRPSASTQRCEAITILFNQVADPSVAQQSDERTSSADIIRADNHWSEERALRRLAPTHLRGLAQAGRLAADESGMLVFTQDGSIARQLTGRESRWEKEYHVRFVGELNDKELDLLRHGLILDGIKLPRIQVSRLSEQQLRFVVRDNGRRQIQRMCELIALPVRDIKRVRIGSVSLGRLPPGTWRYLGRNELF